MNGPKFFNERQMMAKTLTPVGSTKRFESAEDDKLLKNEIIRIKQIMLQTAT